jgi:CRP-like cAMP-binding protein
MPHASAPPSPAQTIPMGFVTRMEGYDVLKKLPIFQDLTLDEMKAFYNICEQVFYAKGEIIIEQGKQGEALIIVREGSIRVSKVEGGRATTLATLPAGNYVGEMSLIDDAPTSARVTAAESVKALRIKRDRFEQFLFANDRIALRVYRTFVRTMSSRLRDTNAQMGAHR